MKIYLPSEMYGNNPAGLIEYCGLHVAREPTQPENVWEVEPKPINLIEAKTLHSPGLKYSKFDMSAVPDPGIPGGIPSTHFGLFQKTMEDLYENPTLPSLFEQIITRLLAVPDNEVPAEIAAASAALAAVTPVPHEDETPVEPLFPRHSVHDIRIDPIAYRWSKLPQISIRLKYNTAAELAAAAQAESGQLAFNASGALLEGTIFGGLYFAPLLGNMSPMMWGIGAPRLGQVIIYTFGRLITGRGTGASRDQLDSLQALTHYAPAHQFDAGLDTTSLHKTAFSDAVDWWAERINKTLLDLFSPTTYINSSDYYVPAQHQRWMLNLEQMFSRIGAIIRHPRDQSAQLMLMFPAMDILADSFTGSNGIGQLMTPNRIGKRIDAIQQHVPARIKPLVMATAYRALRAAEQVADEFFVDSPDPDATTESRLKAFWNALRNTTHGFNNNAEILAEHSGRLPADIVLVPYVYLLDILTDRQYLLARIARNCRVS